MPTSNDIENASDATEAQGNEQLAAFEDPKLTTKQNKAIPILALAETIHAGVQHLIKLGIVSTQEYYYRSWHRQPYFMRVLTSERAKQRGQLVELMRNQVYSEGERTIHELLKVAHCEPKSRFASQKVKAIELLLNICEIDTARGGKVDITINNEIKTKQGAFRQLVEEGLRQRHGTLGAGSPRIPNGRAKPSDN